MFINVEIDESVRNDAEVSKRLVEVCPVDIYTLDEQGKVKTVEENLDECTLCRLCLEASPGDTVRVVRLYRKGEDALVR